MSWYHILVHDLVGFLLEPETLVQMVLGMTSSGLAVRVVVESCISKNRSVFQHPESLPIPIILVTTLSLSSTMVGGGKHQNFG